MLFMSKDTVLQMFATLHSFIFVTLEALIKSVYNPQNFLCKVESVCHAEQNGEKSFVFGQNWNFLWIFKLPKKQGLKTHNRGAEFT